MLSLEKTQSTTTNRILSALTSAEYERLAIHMEPVNLAPGEVLYQPDQPIAYVYFPNYGTVSLVSTFEDGESVEVGMVGNEGMFGVSVFLGCISTPLEAIVQLPGNGFRMRADVLRHEFKKGGELQDLLLGYTQAFITQIAQAAACNRIHAADGRLVRWLLMCYDRSQSEDLPLTHEFISTMLGTRRAGITEAAGRLQALGLIKYRRGHITILDRQGMEAASCECYPILKKEFARLVNAK
jgi:CRP-like cAMP-binding protein